jgi:soluble P-type ATPase
MIPIQRPGLEPLEIEFILIDFEGTLATDRRVHPKAKDKINLLSKRAKLSILTKGERGVVERALKNIKAQTVYLKAGDASREKLDLLEKLGRDRTVVIGNGLDDAPLIEKATLGICVIGKEGAAAAALAKADVVVTDVLDALDFLLKPLRQKSTLCK